MPRIHAICFVPLTNAYPLYLQPSSSSSLPNASPPATNEKKSALPNSVDASKLVVNARFLQAYQSIEQQGIPTIRLNLIKFIRASLFGSIGSSNNDTSNTDDAVFHELVAELVLVHMLSRVHARKPGQLIGGISLNLCLKPDSPGTPSVFRRRFTHLMSGLLPGACHLDMNVDVLSKAKYQVCESDGVPVIHSSDMNVL